MPWLKQQARCLSDKVLQNQHPQGTDDLQGGRQRSKMRPPRHGSKRGSKLFSYPERCRRSTHESRLWRTPIGAQLRERDGPPGSGRFVDANDDDCPPVGLESDSHILGFCECSQEVLVLRAMGRRRPTRPDRFLLFSLGPPLWRSPRCRHKPSPASSGCTDASDAASETGRTTDYGCSSSAADSTSPTPSEEPDSESG